MQMRVVLAAAATLGLAACADTGGGFKPNASVAVPGSSAPVQATVQYDYLYDLNARLRAAAAALGADSRLRWLPRADGLPCLRLDGAAFRAGSGELDAASLSSLDSIAQVLTHSGAYVVHVLGERGDEAGTAPGSELGERRAAAVAAVLSRLGVPDARLRALSREQPGSSGGVLLIVKPVIAGQEPEAWVPPPVEA